MPDQNRIVLTAPIEGDLVKALDLFCRKHDRPRTWVVRKALFRFLAEEIAEVASPADDAGDQPSVTPHEGGV